jgi:hypothetical protein
MRGLEKYFVFFKFRGKTIFFMTKVVIMDFLDGIFGVFGNPL